MHSVSMQMFKILTELIFRDLDRKIQIEPATRARICKRLWSLGINSEELIPPAYVAWWAGTTNM